MDRDFPGLPDNTYDYQNEFDYSVWTPNTEIICATVPWDSTYRDIVRFASKQEREAYFASLFDYSYCFTLKGAVYLRYGEPIRVNAPFSMINQCNYLIVKNPLQPIPSGDYDGTKPGRKPDAFYYFINDVTYVAPNTTQLNVQLDVWQTYYDRIQFGLCYVERGHISIANENLDQSNASVNKYLLEPEGMEIGGEYQIVQSNYRNFQDKQAWVVIVSSADLTASFGSVSNPNLTTAKGSSADGMPSGCDVYACTSSDFKKLMSALQNAPWVSQCISYVSVVPEKFINTGDAVTVHGAQLFELVSFDRPERLFQFDHMHTGIDNWLGDYKDLTKFKTYPYSCFEMTNYCGGELVLKPECLPDSELIGIGIISSCSPPNIRSVVYPIGYNGDASVKYDIDYINPDGEKHVTHRSLGEFLDMGLVFDNFPQLPLVNNMYQYYMASTVHSRAYAQQSAAWSQQKALAGANLSYRQATNAMDTMSANTQAQTDYMNVMTQMGNVKSGLDTATGLIAPIAGTVTGIATLAASKNPAAAKMAAGIAGDFAVQAVPSVTSFATGAAVNDATVAKQTGLMNAQLQNNLGNMTFNRDTNMRYAQFAAQGDYAMALQGIQAKVQDARVTQPSTSGQNGGNVMAMTEGLYGVMMIAKIIKTEYIIQIGNYWRRYGYAINQFMWIPEDLKCMSNFTYWKMGVCNLATVVPIPGNFRDAIRGIFEKGVTVWTDPKKINMIGLSDNEIVPGVGY